ncbi:MAG: hypothetical protein AAAB35_16255 [Phyllobacterium sp.]|uniref:hypothetical protein n=1 Tax=Phyllobacterium sp. TaxID=1871046 RepID=UPI0030EFF430
MFDPRIARKAVAPFIVFAAMSFALPASALSMKECSVKYKAAQVAGDATGVSWNDFRKANCASDPGKTQAAEAETGAEKPDTPALEETGKRSKKSPKKAESASKLGSGRTSYPSSVAAKFSSETPSKTRMHTCLEQYHANKENGTLDGMRWIQQGGGYYSKCNARLKGESQVN